MANLYEITLVNKGIVDRLIENGGELTPEIEEELNAVELSLSDKVNGIVKVCSNFDSDVTAIDVEIRRLQAIKKVRSNSQQRLKDYIKDVMEGANLKTIESPLYKISIAKNPVSVDIYDKGIVPAKYTTTETVTSINKVRIKEDLVKGVKVEGCNLISDKTNLRIK